LKRQTHRRKIAPDWIILCVTLLVPLILFGILPIERKIYRENFLPMVRADRTEETVAAEYRGTVLELDSMSADVYAYLTIADIRLPALFPEKDPADRITFRFGGTAVTVSPAAEGEKALYVTVDKGLFPIAWKLSGYGSFEKILDKMYQQTGNDIFLIGDNT